jgi:hypothetical protein
MGDVGVRVPKGRLRCPADLRVSLFYSAGSTHELRRRSMSDAPRTSHLASSPTTNAIAPENTLRENIQRGMAPTARLANSRAPGGSACQ